MNEYLKIKDFTFYMYRHEQMFVYSSYIFNLNVIEALLPTFCYADTNDSETIEKNCNSFNRRLGWILWLCTCD